MIGIIGGKFGIYGWLSAILKSGYSKSIALETRHMEEFTKYNWLVKHTDQIVWVDSPYDVITLSENLVLAIPPDQTFDYLESICKAGIKTLIVEKPICETPEKAFAFITAVEASGIVMFSSFLFLFTNWYIELADKLFKMDKNEIVVIDWFFKADHFKNNKENWKRYHKQGGGPLRFYGIHLIALMADLGYRPYKQTIDYDSCYTGVWISDQGPDIITRINCRADNDRFEIKGIVNVEHPFDDVYLNLDNRIPYIEKLLEVYNLNQDYLVKHTKKTINLWQQVEELI
jgi:predicted dehydrogenase